MANIVHNLGLELPVYPPDTNVAWSDEDIESAARSGADRFVRRAMLIDNYSSNLKSALDLASRLLWHTAAYGLAATVIPYEWGLYEGTYPRAEQKLAFDSGRHSLVPKGYSLVACVEAIKGRAPNDNEVDILQAHLDNYYAPDGRHTEIHQVMQLSDIIPQQCMLRFYDDGSEPCWSIVDIEPRMKRSGLPMYPHNE